MTADRSYHDGRQAGQLRHRRSWRDSPGPISSRATTTCRRRCRSPSVSPASPTDRGRTSRLQTLPPGRRRLADAQPVTLGLGEEIGIDLMIATPLVAGQVDANDGSTASRGGAITVHVVDDVGNPRDGVEVRRRRLREGDGRTIRACAIRGNGCDAGLGQRSSTPTTAVTHASTVCRPVTTWSSPFRCSALWWTRNAAITPAPTCQSTFRSLRRVPMRTPCRLQPWDDVNLEIALTPSARHTSPGASCGGTASPAARS